MSKSFFESKRWKQTMNFIYGMGAAVVIVGALFKILHLPGADLMLMVGLLTEAGIFMISAFEPVHQDPDWSLVYPELAGGEPTTRSEKQANKGSITQQLDNMLSEAKIGPELIQSLGTGLSSLSTNVKDMADLSGAAVATTEYASSANRAAKNMEEISKSTAMVSDSLSSFTGGLNSVLTNLNASEAATSDFRDELGKLNRNLGNLNTIYGNMLSAMGGSKG
ncbi:MAG: gliding motility protein GldL [Bacteroidetes bacterium]|nr:gliding motility protein GldL [Bacteroidota bacterium]